jgi:hypothetical protein
MRSNILGLTVLLVIAACGANNPVQPDVPFRVIGVADLPGIPVLSPSVTAIRSSGEWEAFVQQSGLRAPSWNPDDPLPEINFSSEMAIVVRLGTRPTTGFRIDVQRVTRDGSELVVHVTEMPPCGGATVITYPVAGIAVPREAGGISAVWAKSLPACQ